MTKMMTTIMLCANSLMTVKSQVWLDNLLVYNLSCTTDCKWQQHKAKFKCFDCPSITNLLLLR